MAVIFDETNLYNTLTFGNSVVNRALVDTTVTDGLAKNTLTDFGLIATAPLTVSTPSLRSNFVDIPYGNGSLDLTEALTGYPTYQNRTGNWQFYVLRENIFTGEDIPNYLYTGDRYAELYGYLHGKEKLVVINKRYAGDATTTYFYKGRFTVDSWSRTNDSKWDTVTISYNLLPYARSIMFPDEYEEGGTYNFMGSISLVLTDSNPYAPVYFGFKNNDQDNDLTVKNSAEPNMNVHTIGAGSDKILWFPEFYIYGAQTQQRFTISSNADTSSIPRIIYNNGLPTSWGEPLLDNTLNKGTGGDGHWRISDGGLYCSTPTSNDFNWTAIPFSVAMTEDMYTVLQRYSYIKVTYSDREYHGNGGSYISICWSSGLTSIDDEKQVSTGWEHSIGGGVSYLAFDMAYIQLSTSHPYIWLKVYNNGLKVLRIEAITDLTETQSFTVYVHGKRRRF